MMNIKDAVAKYIKDLQEENDTEWVIEHILRNDFHSEYIKQVKAKDIKKYVYMVTFTVDPNKITELDEEREDEIETFIIKQSKRTALQLNRYDVVKEHHKDGRPHWHVLAVTRKPLKKDRFNYYIKKYGNIDISKSKSGDPVEIENYIHKTGEPKSYI